MRTIKFRAWDKRFKKMVYASPMAILNLDDKDHEIMQFTGLHDKNGKEIWEGDIVKQCDDFFEVKYGLQEIDAFETIGWNLVSFMDNLEPDGKRLKSEIEVIGNIYENPELISYVEHSETSSVERSETNKEK